MEEKKEFKCDKCGEERVTSDKEKPSCCEKNMTQMKKIPPCNKPKVAEDARFNDKDQPCNEFLDGETQQKDKEN